MQQIAIVTGGSSGIGQRAALECARNDMRVVLTYGRHPERAEETVRAIEELGGSAISLLAWVTGQIIEVSGGHHL